MCKEIGVANVRNRHWKRRIEILIFDTFVTILEFELTIKQKTKLNNLMNLQYLLFMKQIKFFQEVMSYILIFYQCRLLNFETSKKRMCIVFLF